jgi:hypothetical protein
MSIQSFRSPCLHLRLVVALSAIGILSATIAAAAPVVPGTGIAIKKVGDDFEDPDWKYSPNLPKSSEEIDGRTRNPAGRAANGRWYEGMKRGTPDHVKRVETPAGGLEGSEGSLLIQSLRTGVPGVSSHKMQQDDFIADVYYRLGGAIPVSQTPSVVTRIFLPPVDQWEDRTGPSFAFRSACLTHAWKEKESTGFFKTTGKEFAKETYWPGFFFEFQSKTDRGREQDTAYLRIRSNNRGGDFKGKQIEVTGWWTLGMSFTPDGQIHYYAKPGIEDLTAEDHITSQYPYGFRCEHFKTFFYNVCNGDDNRTWSTPWIVDDPTVYFIPTGNGPRYSNNKKTTTR